MLSYTYIVLVLLVVVIPVIGGMDSTPASAIEHKAVIVVEVRPGCLTAVVPGQLWAVVSVLGVMVIVVTKGPPMASVDPYRPREVTPLVTVYHMGRPFKAGPS